MISIGKAAKGIAVVLFTVLSFGCASTPVVEEVESAPNRNLELVVTDLVSALIQIPSLNPTVTTLQMSQPETDLGRALLTAIDNAGYGIQIVDADQGNKYLSYAVRTAETEAGIINDYLIGIDEIELRREYNTTETGIYPSSLLFVKGVEDARNIVLTEEMFLEQGGGELFLSGVDPGRAGISDPSEVREVYTDDALRTQVDKRVDQAKVFAEAQENMLALARDKQRQSLGGLDRHQRVVLLFPNNTELTLGVGNKTAIRNLLGKFEAGDVLDITACDDVDGRNEMAERRAIRIKEELLSHGVESSSIRRAECTRTNFRHHSDDSPQPVTIVHYKSPTLVAN